MAGGDNTMNLDWLKGLAKGKLTYAVGFGLIAYGLLLMAQSQTEAGTKAVLEGFGFLGIRRALGEGGEE